MASGSNTRSIPDLFADLLAQSTSLLRQEGRLARAEVSEKFSQVSGAFLLMLTGAVLLIPALVLLFEAAVLAMVEAGWAPAAASVVIGGGALLLGLVLVLVGKSRLAPASLAPSRTVGQLQRDVAVAQHQIRTTEPRRTDHAPARGAA